MCGIVSPVGDGVGDRFGDASVPGGVGVVSVACEEPGGHLCIVDLEFEDGTLHGVGFGGQRGFRREQLGEQLEAGPPLLSMRRRARCARGWPTGASRAWPGGGSWPPSSWGPDEIVVNRSCGRSHLACRTGVAQRHIRDGCDAPLAESLGSVVGPRRPVDRPGLTTVCVESRRRHFCATPLPQRLSAFGVGPTLSLGPGPLSGGLQLVGVPRSAALLALWNGSSCGQRFDMTARGVLHPMTNAAGLHPPEERTPPAGQDPGAPVELPLGGGVTRSPRLGYRYVGAVTRRILRVLLVLVAFTMALLVVGYFLVGAAGHGPVTLKDLRTLYWFYVRRNRVTTLAMEAAPVLFAPFLLAFGVRLRQPRTGGPGRLQMGAGLGLAIGGTLVLTGSRRRCSPGLTRLVRSPRWPSRGTHFRRCPSCSRRRCVSPSPRWCESVGSARSSCGLPARWRAVPSRRRRSGCEPCGSPMRWSACWSAPRGGSSRWCWWRTSSCDARSLDRPPCGRGAASTASSDSGRSCWS